MKSKRPAGFLNVDLDIESSSRLEVLAKELSLRLLVLYSGLGKGRRHLLRLESSRRPNTPDSAAMDLCRAIEKLSPSARRVWNRANRREFNLGYDLPREARIVEVVLKPETLRRIVALNGTVAFTCYRGEEDEAIAPSPQNPPPI